jgi:hypothetical protein
MLAVADTDHALDFLSVLGPGLHVESWYVSFILHHGGLREAALRRLTQLPFLEIFLPSYVDCYYVPLENRRDPVHEIHLTDEEMKNMFPE